MVAFLVSETAFFSTLIVVYLTFLGADQSGPTPAVLSLPLVICTTICLLSSSVTVYRAEKALRAGARSAFIRWWSATIVLGIVFLAGTAYEWNGLIVEHGLTISRNMFGTTYYTLVGFHALHVSVGMIVMLTVLGLALSHQSQDVGGRNQASGVELVSWYWHFVDGVWVVVFTVVYLFGKVAATPGGARTMKALLRPFGLSLVLLAGCDLPGRPNPADRPVPADKVMDFSVLYQENCAGCHGQSGKLGPAPPLNDPLFRAIVPQEELEDILTKGRKLMPAFAKENGGGLTAPQIQVLVKEIKGIPYKIVEKLERGVAKALVVPDAGGISPKWGMPEKPPQGVPSYREPSACPVPSLPGGEGRGSGAGNKEKGAVVFARACAACHGSHGQGIAKGSEMARTINDPVFLALISNQALRRYAITGRPDLGMPNYAKARPGNPDFVPLTDQDVADLVALLDSWRREK
jgi:cytochrome c oxidase subunit 3/cytochrome o ubiquinol oxidase subunit 3